MPRITKQRYTVWVLKKKIVPKGTPGATLETRESEYWYAANIPRHKGVRVSLRTPNVRKAEKLLQVVVDFAAAGGDPRKALDPPKDGQSLELLVSEFEAAVRLKAGASHTRSVVTDVRRVLTACHLETVADLRAPGVAAKVEQWVIELTQGKYAITSATAAYIGKHARQFTRWLWRKRELLDRDPLAGMDLPSQDTTKKRRALTAEELAALVSATESSEWRFRGLTGPDRAILYLTAVATGYRAEELSRLTPANFSLDAEPPVVWLKGRQTKNKKPADQPIPRAVAARLRLYIADRPSNRPVWPGTWFQKAADMFREDLEAAAVPEMVNEEVAVFHSLRHSYTSLLAEVAPVKVAQELSRHSCPSLTIGRYAHAGAEAKVRAVELLPLPGCGEPLDPLSAMTRQELEDALAGCAALLGVFLTSLLTSPGATDGDTLRLAGTIGPRKAVA